jgi:sugar lactone lactonase YvrE
LIGTLDEWQMPQSIGCVVMRKGGGCMLALASGFFAFNPEGAILTKVAHTHRGETGLELNDGKCDRYGRFWAGSMVLDRSKARAALFRLDADHTCHRMPFNLFIANGIAFSPDNRVLYYADSGTRCIMACDYDIETGILGTPRVFAEIDPPGVPDGSTVDADGFLWNAEFNGWRITRYDPSGKVERRLSTPMQQPTSCIFGGPNHNLLYVTTSRLGLSVAEDQAQPLAGSILVYALGVQGLPEPSYAG